MELISACCAHQCAKSTHKNTRTSCTCVAIQQPPPQVGDGDCGATLAGGGRGVLAALDAGAVPLHCAPAAAAAVAVAVRGCVGGSSGALYDILLTAAARQLKVGGASALALCVCMCVYVRVYVCGSRGCGALGLWCSHSAPLRSRPCRPVAGGEEG